MRVVNLYKEINVYIKNNYTGIIYELIWGGGHHIVINPNLWHADTLPLLHPIVSLGGTGSRPSRWEAEVEGRGLHVPLCPISDDKK